jgi:hypothetical protein
MCVGVAVAWGELPLELIERCGLERRAHDRGGEREVRFLFRDRDRCLPVWRGGQLEIVRWGQPRGLGGRLPATGWTWRETVESGWWNESGAEAVDIPALAALANGVWYFVRQGIRGLWVPGEDGAPAAYMVCEPASHYYKTMTGCRWMPTLIGEQI